MSNAAPEAREGHDAHDKLKLASAAAHAAAAAAAAAAPVPPARRRRKQRYTRSRSGCLTCRRRKVKCDEAKPVCAKCADLEKECIWPVAPAFEFRLVGKDAKDGASDSGVDGDLGNPQRSRTRSRSFSQTRSPSPKRFRAFHDIPALEVAPTEDAWTDYVQTTSYTDDSERLPALLDSVSPTSSTHLPGTMGPPPVPRAVHQHENGPTQSPTTTAETDMRVPLWLDQLASLAAAGPAPAATTGTDESSPSSEEGSVLELMREQAGNALVAAGANAGLNGMIDPALLLLGAGQPFLSSILSQPQQRFEVNPCAAASRSGSGLPPPPDLTALSSSRAAPNFSLASSTLAVRRGMGRLTASVAAAPALTTAPTDPIANAYPSETGRRLFHHFVSLTSTFVIAMGTRMRDKSKNPFIGVSVPLIVCDMDSPAQTALRLGVLSLAATHMHHQYLEAGGHESAAEMYEETQRAKRQANAHMLLSLSREGDKHIDMLMATCMTLKTRDILLADKTWQKNLDFGLRLITRRGGPEPLIAEEPHNFQRRFVIEQLLTSDVISTFSTGAEPMFLPTDASWWTDWQTSASSEWQWEAYEYQFGISRAMIHLIARCRVLVYRRARVSDLADPSDRASPTISALLDALDADARALIDELRTYSITQLHTPQRARVRLGDGAYRYAMLITLLTEVLGIAASDERVQTAVRSVLELCSETSMEPVMLAWPLLIASGCASGPDRAWVRDLFDVFKRIHCSDLLAAERLVEGQWARIDSGRGFAPWPKLMREMDMEVLLI